MAVVKKQYSAVQEPTALAIQAYALNRQCAGASFGKAGFCGLLAAVQVQVTKVFFLQFFVGAIIV